MSAGPLPQPFLIVALPRSRTAWLANWLTFGAVRCAHELSLDARQGATFRFALQAYGAGAKYSGAADTLAAMFLPELVRLMPELRIVVIRRNPDAVARSLVKLGFPDEAKNRVDLESLDQALDRAAGLPGAISFRCHELDQAEIGREILAHVAPGERFDACRWRMLRGLNVQITPARLAQLEESAGALFSNQTRALAALTLT